MLPSLVVVPIAATRSAQATEMARQERVAAGTQLSLADEEQYQFVSQLSSTSDGTEVDEVEIWFSDPETDLTDAGIDLEDLEEGVFAIPAEEAFPPGFDRDVLTVPEIGSVQEFQQFVARIRSIEDEELKDDAILLCYLELIDAKHLAIMEAADQMLPKVKDEEAIFSIHAVKFKEFRQYRFSSDVAQTQFERYAEELSQHPIKQVRSIPEGYDLLMATVFTTVAEAPESMHMELVQNLFAYIDEYGVNKVSAETSESIALMYDADSYPNLTPVLFQGLAERFEQAPRDDARLQELAAQYREQAEALTDN